MWLNPVVDKFKIMFGGDFFANDIAPRYNNYLRNKNQPLKTVDAMIVETINGVNVPGFNLPENTITGLSNLGSGSSAYDMDTFPNPTTQMTMPSEVSLIETFTDRTIRISMRNNILNWLYFYEIYRGYFSNNRTIDVFPIYLTIMDGAEIEIMRFIFSACYVSGMGELEFSTNSQFREARMIEAQIVFNSMDVETLIPDLNMKTINL